MSLKIAITQNVTDLAFLAFCEKNKIELVQVPQIQFKHVKAELPTPTSFNIVFFSSRRSVDSFFSQFSLSPEHLVACIGNTTASRLKKYVSKIDFIGEKSGQPKAVAQQFKAFVGPKTVLFPQSQISNQSMQKALDENQLINLVTYHTLEVPTELPIVPDYLIFTSPSNVRAYLSKNKLSATTAVISWGDTTSDTLAEFEITPKITLTTSSFDELIENLK